MPDNSNFWANLVPAGANALGTSGLNLNAARSQMQTGELPDPRFSQYFRSRETGDNQSVWESANARVDNGGTIDGNLLQVSGLTPDGLFDPSAVHFDPEFGLVTDAKNVKPAATSWLDDNMMTVMTAAVMGPALVHMGAFGAAAGGAEASAAGSYPGLEAMVPNELSGDLFVNAPNLTESLVPNDLAGLDLGAGTPAAVAPEAGGGGYTVLDNVPAMEGPGAGEAMNYSDLTFPSQTGGDLPYGTEMPNSYDPNWTGLPTEYSAGPGATSWLDRLANTASRLPGIMNAVGGHPTPGSPGAATAGGGIKTTDLAGAGARGGKPEAQRNPYASAGISPVGSLMSYLRGVSHV